MKVGLKLELKAGEGPMRPMALTRSYLEQLSAWTGTTTRLPPQ